MIARLDWPSARRRFMYATVRGSCWPRRVMPASRRRERLRPEQPAIHVDHCGNVRIAMSVDPTNHQTR